MSAKAKSAPSRKPAPIDGLIRRALHAVAGLAILAGLVAALAAWVWNYAHAQLRSDARYFVRAEQIALIPAPPSWIRSDLRAEVLHEGSFDQPISILDENLARQMTQAFQLNPWVAKVDRVAKTPPNRVEVSLQYRRPVCLVETPRGLIPIDLKGVLLPGDHFTPLESQTYPHLVGIQTAPLGPVGTVWGDPLVPGGAEIADALLPSWTQLGLRAIVPLTATDGVRAAERTYDLFTIGGSRIVWGSPPGAEQAGESPAKDKVARLQKLAGQQGSLDVASGAEQIDLRFPAPDRTANQADAGERKR